MNASNVVVDLKGFILATTDTSFTDVGIAVSTESSNVTIQDGLLSGFAYCVHLFGRDETVQNLRLETKGLGVLTELTSVYSMIQDCFVLGGGIGTPLINVGIIAQGEGTVVKNNHVVNEDVGCVSGGGAMFIANYIASCGTGLSMASTDKYQGNVTVNCIGAFSGGIAVGTENN